MKQFDLSGQFGRYNDRIRAPLVRMLVIIAAVGLLASASICLPDNWSNPDENVMSSSEFLNRGRFTRGGRIGHAVNYAPSHGQRPPGTIVIGPLVTGLWRPLVTEVLFSFVNHLCCVFLEMCISIV